MSDMFALFGQACAIQTTSPRIITYLLLSRYTTRIYTPSTMHTYCTFSSLLHLGRVHLLDKETMYTFKSPTGKPLKRLQRFHGISLICRHHWILISPFGQASLVYTASLYLCNRSRSDGWHRILPRFTSSVNSHGRRSDVFNLTESIPLQAFYNALICLSRLSLST